jgi:Fe-S-cluster-containing dehydrogenase component
MTQLALVIDLNVCVGCHACVTSCKQWNTSGWAGPLADQNPYGAGPTGTFFNRVQTFEIGRFPATETLHFPKSCLHCEEPPCVPVCPPAPPTSARTTAWCWSITTSASAANTAPGPVPTGRGSTTSGNGL